eukprot:s295_g18.t1
MKSMFCSIWEEMDLMLNFLADFIQLEFPHAVEAVKEILLAGDANRLVAELTFVRINDLAAPPDKIDAFGHEKWKHQRSAVSQDVVIPRGHPNLIWNWCDIGFIGTAITDLLLEVLRVDSGAMFFTTLLRFVRLVRLTRIVKVFRLHWMKELRLMLKGFSVGIEDEVVRSNLCKIRGHSRD